MKLKTSMLVVVAILVSLALLAGCSSGPKSSSTGGSGTFTADYQKIIDAAQKEKQLVIYGTDTPEETSKVATEFNKHYGTNIEVVFWRGKANEIYEKASDEYRSGRYEVDYYGTMDAPEVASYIKEGLIKTDHKWPSVPDWKDKGFMYPGYNIPVREVLVISPAYNTKLIDAKDLPKTWMDLTTPKYKGKIAMDYGAYQTILGWSVAFGKEKTVELVKGLAANQVILRKGHTATTEMLAAGEFPMAVELYGYAVDQLRDVKGAPIDEVPLNDTLVGRPSFQGIAAKAPHPNAAILWGDYVTGTGKKVMEQVTGKYLPGEELYANALKKAGGKIVMYGTDMNEDDIKWAQQVMEKELWPLRTDTKK